MNGTVLILDDSLTVRMDLAEAFAAAGLDTTPCATAAQARARLAGTSGDERPVDVIILDVLLPDGDGIDLLREIRQDPATAGAVILVLSSEAEVKDRVRGLTTGADEYVGKPYDAGYVVARAQELVRARHEADPDDRADPAPHPTSVLVIDDSATIRAQLRQELEACGYQVLTAAGGEEGLRAAATERPDAVVVDGALPDLDGATVVRRLRLDAALRATPCLLLTGSEDQDAELRALDAGADEFVRKGEDAAVLLAKLSALLRRAVPAGPILPTASLASPKKVLAVDGEAGGRSDIAQRLRAEGYDVVPAHSGEEALELLAVQAVDCALVAARLAGELTGVETCRRIKAAPGTRDIPLLLLADVDDRAATIEALGAGADDVIPPNGEPGVVVARIRAQMRRRQFEDENRRIREELLRKELDATQARARVVLAETRAALVGELERKNQELEAFSYSVSHDLRAPLRSIVGFGTALQERSAEQLDQAGRDHLARVLAAAARMGELIDDMLELSRVSSAELRRGPADLTAIVRGIAADLAQRDPERQVAVVVQDGVTAQADSRLVRAALENLLGNAWKFTNGRDGACIEFGVEDGDGGFVYFVRDNGAGFDMNHAQRLFTPFQRLHSEQAFPGTGIGLATVHRIIDRHGGRVWAQAEVARGATFRFTIPPPAPLTEPGALAEPQVLAVALAVPSPG